MRKFRKEHCSVQEAFASNIQISPHLEKGQKGQRKKHKLMNSNSSASIDKIMLVLPTTLVVHNTVLNKINNSLASIFLLPNITSDLIKSSLAINV